MPTSASEQSDEVPVDGAAPIPLRPLTPKAQATRARLIELAAEVFATEGYAAPSVRDLARRSGLSTGAIYGRFKDKADLLAEAVEAAIATELETFPADVLASPLPEIDAYNWAKLDHPARVRLRALLLEAAAAARTDAEVRERLRATVSGRLDSWTVAHDAWAAARGIDDEIDMRVLVVLQLCADLGVGVLEALGVDVPDPDEWAALIRSMLSALENR